MSDQKFVFLPCLGSVAYWAKTMQHVEKQKFTLYTCHTFQKQTALSQFEIVTSNGRQKLSIPTIKNTRKGAYENVKIDESQNWSTLHWRSIENAYQKSPFFLYYGYKIEPVFKAKTTNLLEYNKQLFAVILNCLKIELVPYFDTTTPVHYKTENQSVNQIYPQVFDDKLPFQENLSILDILFNLGPETKDYLDFILP